MLVTALSKGNLLIHEQNDTKASSIDQ